MDNNIEQNIKSLMVGADNTRHVARPLAPYLMSASDLIKADIPPKEFLVSTFMPKASFGMVFAPRGLGKSWFAMGLARAIAVGHDTFLGWKIHQQGDVLFIDGEMSIVDLRERAQSLLGRKGSSSLHIMPSENLFRDGCPICLDVPQEHQAIFDLLESMKVKGIRPKLIVFDNLSTLRRGVNENDNSETQALLDFLVKLRHMGYAVLLVHHTNKAGEQRGASILEVPMDYIIKLNHPSKAESAFKKGASFMVEFTKVRNRAPLNRDFICDLVETENGELEFAIDTEATEVSNELILLRMIAQCDGNPTVRYFASKLGWSTGKVSKNLKVLREEEGAILKECYTLTKRGEFLLHETYPSGFPEPQGYREYNDNSPF